MGLLSTVVKVRLHGMNIAYYESIGCHIPRYYNARTCKMMVKHNTFLIIDVNNLSKTSGQKVDAECDCCKKKYKITYAEYVRNNHNGKYYCHACAMGLFNSGKNHPMYKSEKTDKEREEKRLYPEYTNFIKRILARDNYTCQCCGKKSGRLNVHHLDGYDWCVEKRTDDTNGITLCRNCHKNFHSIYGSGGNTKEQFIEWFQKTLPKLKKYNGSITSARKIYCYEEGKIYNSALEFAQSHNVKKHIVYAVCNRKNFCRTVKKLHVFWNDEYINFTDEELQQYLSTVSRNPRSKQVICLTTHNKYPSISSASREESICRAEIIKCCDGIIDYAINKKGIKSKWQYA